MATEPEEKDSSETQHDDVGATEKSAGADESKKPSEPTPTPSAPSELPRDVQNKLKKLDKVESSYAGRWLGFTIHVFR
jgi:hypothetical protein